MQRTTAIDKVTFMRKRIPKAASVLIVLCAMLVVSTGLLVGKTRISPHQLTIFFTGDDWGKYKYCT
jgi:hypothetical protein